MLLDSIESQIISILADKKWLRAAEIDRRLVIEHGCEASLPTIYRHISALVESQVLICYRRKYALSKLWIENLSGLKNHIETTYKSPDTVFILPEREGQHFDFFASSLSKLDPIWNQLLLLLASDSSEKELFGFNSHAWHAIAMTTTEKALYKSLSKIGIATYLFFGNNTPLDQRGAELIEGSGLSTSIAPKHSFPREGYALWANKKFILECHFPDSVNKRFARLFKHSDSDADPELDEFQAIFKLSEKFRLRLVRNEEKASAVVKNFQSILN